MESAPRAWQFGNNQRAMRCSPGDRGPRGHGHRELAKAFVCACSVQHGCDGGDNAGELAESGSVVVVVCLTRPSPPSPMFFFF